MLAIFRIIIELIEVGLYWDFLSENNEDISPASAYTLNLKVNDLFVDKAVLKDEWFNLGRSY